MKKKKKLSFPQAWHLGTFDNAKRWYPDSTIEDYFLGNYRAPSRAWSTTYLRAATTYKFYGWMQEHHPALLAEVEVKDSHA